jgi:hypothetical protein
MFKSYSVGLVLMLLSAAIPSCAQDDSGQAQPIPIPQQPAPAYGTDNAIPANSENPPISGLDLPNLQPHAAPLSYLQAGAHFTESVDSNIADTLGGTQVSTITQLLGSVELQRLWSHYDLGLEYVGGVGYYNVSGVGLRQIEELGLDQKVTWKRGELNLRDAFSYQPEGTFGSAYGGVSAAGAGIGEENIFYGASALGDLGQSPILMNNALADVEESLSPKSAITATGGYSFVHFLQNDSVLGNSFIGANETTGQVGYDRLLGRHDQAALVYGYQRFDFSTSETFQNQLIQLMWGHRISGRMNFIIGVGPQFTQSDVPGYGLHISAAGRAQLQYQFPKVILHLTYAHFITTGSGFFAGASTDLARLSASRPLGRRWEGFTDIGYSRNSRVLPTTCFVTASGAPCPGVAANVYNFGFAGAGMSRNFGREFKAFVSYQFNYLSFDSSFCGTTGPCNRISQRQVGTIGLDWTPRPLRID